MLTKTCFLVGLYIFTLVKYWETQDGRQDVFQMLQTSPQCPMAETTLTKTAKYPDNLSIYGQNMKVFLSCSRESTAPIQLKWECFGDGGPVNQVKVHLVPQKRIKSMLFLSHVNVT